jgi:hypothetical protein
MRLLILAPILLAACTTKNDVEINRSYQSAAAAAAQARYGTIAAIAKQGQAGAVAAAMLMQTTGSDIQPPSNGNSALEWAKVLVPAVTTGVTVAANAGVAIRQSDNGKDVAIIRSNNETAVAVDTNATMATIAEATIVRPEVVTSTNTSVTNVLCVTDATYSCE